jgi:hypothetical protein
MDRSLDAATDELLREAAELLSPAVRPELERLRARLASPLRVAIAGQVKAGKSTLLNALVGQPIAPTDAGECTKVVTWYRHGPTYRVTIVGRDGEEAPAQFRREGGSLIVELDGRNADEVERIDVEWPSPRLTDLVLIDTPGLASLSTEVSARSERFLTGAASGDADAVIYLMRHLHPADVNFLEAFRNRVGSTGAAITAIGIVSRADEIGDCRVTAMSVAGRVAEHYRDDPQLRGLCHVVLPVAGLAAEAASTLRESDMTTLRALGAGDPPALNALLLSVHRLLTRGTVLGVPYEARRELLDRMGLFGVRMAVELLRTGRAGNAEALANELLRRSGLLALRQVLLTQFAARSQVLKARSALAALADMARAEGGESGRATLDRVRMIEMSAHELTEIEFLQRLRADPSDFPGVDRAEAVRLMGEAGPEPWRRLGVDAGSPAEALRSACLVEIARWRTVAEDPLLGRSSRELADAVVRSCEGVYVGLPAPPT